MFSISKNGFVGSVGFSLGSCRVACLEEAQTCSRSYLELQQSDSTYYFFQFSGVEKEDLESDGLVL